MTVPGGQREQLMELAKDACSRLLGVAPTSVEPPPMTRIGPAEMVRCRFGGRSVLATYRDNSRAAALEVRVLRELGRRGGPVPKLVAEGDGWLILEDTGGRPLSKLLRESSPSQVEALLTQALAALHQALDAAQDAWLDAVADPMRDGRLDELIHLAPSAGYLAGLPAPDLDSVALRRAIGPLRHMFTKRNAQPSRALLHDGRILLFDWAEAGPGDPIEDLVTMICDESMPVYPQREAKLLAAEIPRFGAAGRDTSVRVLGTLHMCKRLCMILSYKGQDEWWDDDFTLAGEVPQVSKEAVARLCLRASHWSTFHPSTELLQPWFEELAARYSAAPT